MPQKILDYRGTRTGYLYRGGQLTQYGGEQDAGYFANLFPVPILGLNKRYKILTTLQHAGTTRIILPHYAGGAGAISFVAATQKILDTGNGLAIFLTGDVITTDDPLNPGPFTIQTGGVAGEIVVVAGIVNSTPTGVITISKCEDHSNNVVIDLNNRRKLMYLRYVSNKMGVLSNGKMPWGPNTVPHRIFGYATAANLAGLAEYSDWRVADDVELFSLRDMEQPNAAPDATAFPDWPISDYFWSSTTPPTNAVYAMVVYFDGGSVDYGNKASSFFVALVRGG